MTTPESEKFPEVDSGTPLGGEVDRGQTLDQSLARHIGRRDPDRGAASPTYLATLDQASARVDPGLVLAAKDGDADARARLVEACMPLISSVARTYRTGIVQRQELLQEGVVGVLRALERFDPDRGVPFWAYATWWVRHAMQQLSAELTRPVVLSDRALRHLSKVKAADRDLAEETGRTPGRAALAGRTGLSVDQVDALLATDHRPRSLDEPVHDDRELGTFGELLVDPLAEEEYEQVLGAIEIEDLHTLLAGLSDRERDVVRSRFGFDENPGGESFREIGERLGISGERVRQIERRAVAKLANTFGERC